jgi:hypothetical protein
LARKTPKKVISGFNGQKPIDKLRPRRPFTYCD